MANDIRVRIIGDSTGFERALSRSGAATRGFASELGHMAKIAAFAGGAAAVGGLAIVLDKSVKAAVDAQASQAKLSVAFKDVGLSAAKYAGQVDATEASSRRLGFTNDDTRTSLSRLIVATGDYQKAAKDLSVAQDVARFKGVSLTLGTQMLTSAMAGNQRAIKQLGILISPVTANYDRWKEANKKVTTEAQRLAEAHAKLLDKMATGNEIIDAVTKKLHGQADAYAGTLRGNIDAFKANLNDLEERIGNKLLPKLTELVQWVNDHWPEISKVAGQVATDIGTALSAIESGIAAAVAYIRAHWQQIVGVFDTVKSAVVEAAQYMADEVRSHWQQISQDAHDIFNDVKAVVQAFIQGVELFWENFGGSIKAIARNTWAGIKTIIGAELNVIKGIVNVFAGLIHGDWSRVWQGIKQITSGIMTGIVAIIRGAISNALSAARAVGQAILNGITSILSKVGGKVKGALDAIWHVISGVARSAYTAATAIGAEIIHGIISGIEHMAGSLWGTITSIGSKAVSVLKGILSIGSPSKVMADQVGKPMIEGIVLGITSTAASVGTALTAAVRASIIQAVAAAKQQMGTALAGLNSVLGGITGNATSAFDAVHSGWQSPSAKKLAAMQQEDQQNQLNQALQQAQNQLASDQAAGPQSGETQDQFAARIQADKDAIAAAQRQITEFQLGIQAQNEQTIHDAKVKADKDHFEQQLAALEKEAGGAKTAAAAERIQKKILALYKKYGITPDSLQAATDWSTAQTLFVTGMGDLKTAMDNVVTAANNLRDAILGQNAIAPPAPTGMGHKASGGFLPGPEGQGIPILAHANEYVIRSSATRKLGIPALDYMNKTGNLPKFIDGGKIDPHTGLPDTPLYRQSAMWLNDYGADVGNTAVATALAGLIGPRAQAQAAVRHTHIDGEEVNAGNWRAPDLDPKWVALATKAYPGIVFEAGTPGQQISAGQAVSRLRGGTAELMGLIGASMGLTGPSSPVERMTSHAVHFASGYITDAIAALNKDPGNQKNNPSFIPPMATGGRILSDGLIYGHRGETVVPARVTHGGVNSGFGGDIHIHVPIGNRTVSRTITQQELKERRLGRAPWLNAPTVG